MEQVQRRALALSMWMLAGAAIGGERVTEQVVVAAVDQSCRAAQVGTSADATDGARGPASTEEGSRPRADVKRLNAYMSLHAEVREESGLGEVIPGTRLLTRPN